MNSHHGEVLGKYIAIPKNLSLSLKHVMKVIALPIYLLITEEAAHLSSWPKYKKKKKSYF